MLQSYAIPFYIMVGLIPSVTGLLGYIIRLEKSLATIKTDICWIKNELAKCQQS